MTQPSRRARLAAALAIGAGAAGYAHLTFRSAGHGPLVGDFAWFYRAAQAVAAGQDPYAVLTSGAIHATGPQGVPFVYPLTAAVAALPFAPLPPAWAAPLFAAVGAALFAWALTGGALHGRPRWGGLWAFASVPALWNAATGQWAPFLAGAALLPGGAAYVGGALLAVKPTLGAALFTARPTRRAVAGGLALVALSLALAPAWPLAWLRALAANPDAGQYRPPLAVLPAGPLLLLALLRWRRPEARLLLALALAPQTYFHYDQLPLWLIPATAAESAVLSGLSFAAFVAAGQFAAAAGAQTIPAKSAAHAPALVALLYLPCLVMVLRRAHAPRRSPEPRPELAGERDAALL